MPKKDKKADKKAQKENKEQLSAVDRTFFELTINDLNTKVTNLRKRNTELEEKNVELETQMIQLDEDRADIIAFLNRTVFTQRSDIKNLEEKLSELAKVRTEETEKFQNIINDWESKYKVMHDQLSSEIKLLAGKLNYLEEFRLQHDDLMAKFDQQDRNLKEQEQRHKDTLYELEHKQIAEKVQLKNQLEGRLLELSTQFTQANQIRTAAHVQRMTRENIALTNEIDQLLRTVERMSKENKTLKQQYREKRQQCDTILEENAHLIEAGEKYVKIIARLTGECERLNSQVKNSSEAGKLQKLAEVRETVSRKELNEAKLKLELIQTKLTEHQNDCRVHLEHNEKHRQELARLHSILSQLKKKLGTALQIGDKKVSFENQRKQLLDDLLQILISVKNIDDVVSEESGGEATDEMSPLKESTYHKGKVGITPRSSTKSILKISTAYKGRRKSTLDAFKDHFFDVSKKRMSLVGCVIIDVDDDATKLQSSDSIQVEDEEKEKTVSSSRKPSMIQMSHDLSSEETDDPQKSCAVDEWWMIIFIPYFVLYFFFDTNKSVLLKHF